MRRRTGMLTVSVTVLATVVLTLLAPPIVVATPPPDLAVVDQVDASAVDRTEETTLYSGRLGPDRPFDIAGTEVATGRYTLRLVVAGRFSAATPGALACDVVEERSGIALQPSVSLTVDPSDGWVLERTDVQLSLPEIALAVRCATTAWSFGRLEVLRAELIAEPV